MIEFGISPDSAFHRDFPYWWGARSPSNNRAHCFPHEIYSARSMQHSDDRIRSPDDGENPEEGLSSITDILGGERRTVEDPKSGNPAAVDNHGSLKYHLLGPSLTKAGQDSVDQQKVCKGSSALNTRIIDEGRRYQKLSTTRLKGQNTSITKRPKTRS